MTTWTAFTTLSQSTRAEALGEALEALDPAGVGICEVEDGSGTWEVAAYFEAPPDRAALALLAVVHGARDFAVSELPDTDWVAHVRRELHPVEAGRFFVHGSHDVGKVPPGRIGLLIDAALAFGTGHHATTLGCLRALDRLADRGFSPGKVLDIGCGTAVLAMAAAQLWPAAGVLASDIDPQAVEVAAANAAVNGLAGRVRCLVAPGLDHTDLTGAGLILANILKGPLIDLAPAMAAANRPDGLAILSGLLTPQAAEVTGHYLAAGYSLAETWEIGDWSTLLLQLRP